MEKKYILSILVLCYVLSACKKQEFNCTSFGNAGNLEWSILDCVDSSNFDETGNAYYREVGNQYKFPVFNPNNSNEIIYYEEIRDSIGLITNQRIVKYNIIEDIKIVLKSQVELTAPPAWNRNGLIAYKPSETGYITLMNEDGSNQMQFSDYPTGSSNDNLNWLKNSNVLIWRYNDLQGKDYILSKKITDDSAKTLFIGVINNFTVSSDNVLIISKNNGFETLDLNRDSLVTETLITPLSGSFHHGLKWSPNGDDFYVSMYSPNHGGGLFKVNRNNGNPSKLVKYCNNKMIKFIDCSSKNQKLIIQRFEKFNLEDTPVINNIGERSSIWLLDLKTMKAAKLPL